MEKILILGASGLVGTELTKYLSKFNEYEIIAHNGRKDCDLLNFEKTKSYIKNINPDIIIMCSANVGGILHNMSSKIRILEENLLMQINVFKTTYLLNNLKKFIFFASTCIYPKSIYEDFCENMFKPFKEEDLDFGRFESTNESYAIAKMTGVKMCKYYNYVYDLKYEYNDIKFRRFYVPVVPTNLYGYNDNYCLLNAHVIPALFYRFIYAKEKNKDTVYICGTGSPKRNFLFVEDLVKAIKIIIEKYNSCEPINIAGDEYYSIEEVVYKIKDLVGFKGNIQFECDEKFNGIEHKYVSIDKIKSLGWYPETNLDDGLEKVYDYIMNNRDKLRGWI